MASAPEPVLPISGGLRLLVRGVVGCAVLIVLLGLALFLLVRPRAESRHAEQRAAMELDLKLIESGLERWRTEHGGDWPETLNVLFVPDEAGKSILSSKAPPRDPWGHGYQYAPPGPGGQRARLWSLGRDRREGGEGENADFSNHDISAPR